MPAGVSKGAPRKVSRIDRSIVTTVES